MVRDAADHPALRWFVPVTGALVAFGWTGSVYIQPASADLLRGQVTPLHGVRYAGFTAVSTVVTYKSGAIREQVGAERWIHRTRAGRPRRGVRTVVPVPLLAVPACFTRRTVLGATSFFRDTYVNERAETAGRATVLSAVALVLVLARIPARVGVGVLADATQPLAAACSWWRASESALVNPRRRPPRALWR